MPSRAVKKTASLLASSSAWRGTPSAEEGVLSRDGGGKIHWGWGGSEECRGGGWIRGPEADMDGSGTMDASERDWVGRDGDLFDAMVLRTRCGRMLCLY